jgi:transcriptional regulator with XRE-family HTH domain
MPARRGEERASRVVRESRRYKSEAKALGLRARALRQRRGWTLEHAAEQMSVDLKHLQKIESGQVNITLVTLVRLADGLGEQIASLFFRRRSGG